MEQDFKRRTAELHHSVAELQSEQDSRRSSLSGEQDLRRKCAELSNQLIYLQGELDSVKDSQGQVA